MPNSRWFWSVVFVWMTLEWIPPARGICDPTSHRLIDPKTNKPFPDGSVCPTGEFCKAQDPPATPPVGDCTKKGSVDAPCTSNAGCEPGTLVEANKFVCSKKPGETSGKCGCLHDYLSTEEKEQRLDEEGFSWNKAKDGKGCVKSVQDKRPCNPRTDVCETQQLVCRPRDGKAGDNFCLYPFGTQPIDKACLDPSDCASPFTCRTMKGLSFCDCPESFRKDKNKCIPRYVGFLIQCDNNDDCLPLWHIICDPNKVCNCQSVGRDVYEYFPQINKQDRCYQTYELGEPCTLDGILTDKGADHNCRRRTSERLETNLLCLNGTCACEADHFRFDTKTETCTQLYAWYDEPCNADSDKPNAAVDKLYHCDSKLQLTCGLDFKCQCLPNAKLLLNKRKACQIRTTLKEIGEPCDDESLLCDADLFLGCKNGRCSCVEDPAIVAEGKTCHFINYNRKAAAQRSLPALRSFLALLAAMDF